MALIIPTADAKKELQEDFNKSEAQFTNAGRVGTGIQDNPDQGIATFQNGSNEEKKCYHLSYGLPGTKDTFTAFWAWTKVTPDKVDLLAYGHHVKTNTDQPKKYKIQYSYNEPFFKGTVQIKKK